MQDTTADQLMRDTKALIAQARALTPRTYYGHWTRRFYMKRARQCYDAAIRIWMAEERRYQGGFA
jgi:hypothetical protein